MFRRILVAIDGSETARRGLDYAIQLGREGHAQLMLVHIYDEPLPLAVNGDWTLPALSSEPQQAAGARLLQAALETCRQAGVSAETRLVEAAGCGIGPRISETAAAWQADLIVAGNHARRGLDRLLLGSVAEGILRTARIPVLLVPAS